MFKKRFLYPSSQQTNLVQYDKKNSGKKWNTPLQILNEDFPNVNPQLLILPPVVLDNHYSLYRYKIDPEYQPLTFDSFFQDVPEHLLDLIEKYCF